MSDLNRRQVLAASTGVVVAGMASGGAVASTKIDFSDPQQKLDAYVRMRNRGDGKKSYTRYSGTFFGKIEGDVTVPLVGKVGL